MVSEFNLCFNSSGGFETKLLPTLSLTHNFTFTKLYRVAQFFDIIYFHQQRSSRSTFRQESPDAICATPSTHGSVHTYPKTDRKRPKCKFTDFAPVDFTKTHSPFNFIFVGPTPRANYCTGNHFFFTTPSMVWMLKRESHS